MFSFFKKKPQVPKKPPGKSQIKLCKSLGLTISPKMSREDVSNLLSISLKQEKYKKSYDGIQKKRDEEFEKEDRETYGDALVDELKEWEQYSYKDKQYILIFKRGSNVICDVVEIEDVEIIGVKKHSVQINILLPKLCKDKDTGNYLEWEKEIKLKPSQIHKIEALPKYIDMFDLETYKATKEKHEVMASEFTA